MDMLLRLARQASQPPICAAQFKQTLTPQVNTLPGRTAKRCFLSFNKKSPKQYTLRAFENIGKITIHCKHKRKAKQKGEPETRIASGFSPTQTTVPNYDMLFTSKKYFYRANFRLNQELQILNQHILFVFRHSISYVRIYFFDSVFPQQILCDPNQNKNQNKYSNVGKNAADRISHPIGKVRDWEHDCASNRKINPALFNKTP